MKHLIKYNESDSSDLYIEIDKDEYEALVSKHVSFEEVEFKPVIDLISRFAQYEIKRIGISKRKIFQINKKLSKPGSIDTMTLATITKLEDEWFTCRYHIYDKRYKCDELAGLLSLIKYHIWMLQY